MKFGVSVISHLNYILTKKHMHTIHHGVISFFLIMCSFN